MGADAHPPGWREFGKTAVANAAIFCGQIAGIWLVVGLVQRNDKKGKARE